MTVTSMHTAHCTHCTGSAAAWFGCANTTLWLEQSEQDQCRCFACRQCWPVTTAHSMQCLDWIWRPNAKDFKSMTLDRWQVKVEQACKPQSYDPLG